MKIGITCYPTYGGSGAVATELGIALAHARARDPLHHVPAAVPAPVVPAAHLLPRGGRRPVPAVRVSAVRPGARGAHARGGAHARTRPAARALRHPARDERVDRARDAARRGRDIKVVTTLHGTDITIVGQDPSFHAITKFSIEKSDGLSAVSQYPPRRDAVGVRVRGLPQSRSSTNFIDPTVYDRSRYAPAACASRSNGDKVLMHISNFRAGEARARRGRGSSRAWRSEVPSVLVMVGDGPDRVDAEQEARRLGVAGPTCIFLGKLDAVAPLLASADLFLLPIAERVVRPERARGAGLRRAGRRRRAPAGCPKSCAMARRARSAPSGDVDGMSAAAIRHPARRRALAGDERRCAAADARARSRSIRWSPSTRPFTSTRSVVASVPTTNSSITRFRLP